MKQMMLDFDEKINSSEDLTIEDLIKKKIYLEFKGEKLYPHYKNGLFFLSRKKFKGDYISYHYDRIEDIKHDEMRNNVFDTKEGTTTFLFINSLNSSINHFLKIYYFNNIHDDVTFYKEV